MDIHRVIGNIPFEPRKGFVLPTHRFTGPYNPLHLQLDSKDNPVPGNEQYNAVDAILRVVISAIEITIRQLVNVNVTVNVSGTERART